MPTYNHENIGEVHNYVFLQATVTSVDSDNDTVNIEGERVDGKSVPLFYHCSNDSELRNNGAIEGASTAFSEDDEVIVMCSIVDSQIFTPVRVVGFVEGAKECYNEYLVIQCHGYYIVWDCRRNAEASIVDPISGLDIVFPCEESVIENWINNTELTSAEDCYNMVESTGYTYDAGSDTYTCNNDGCGEIEWSGGSTCGYSIVENIGLCTGGVRLHKYQYYTGIDNAYNLFGSSYILELQNEVFDGETTCFRTVIKTSSLEQERYVAPAGGYTGSTYCMRSVYEYGTLGPCVSYRGNPDTSVYPSYPQADGSYSIISKSGSLYTWVTPLGETEDTVVVGGRSTTETTFVATYIGIDINGNPSYMGTTYTSYGKSEVINLLNTSSKKSAQYSEHTMFQIYVIQFTTVNTTKVYTVGTGWSSEYDVGIRDQKVMSVCDWFHDSTAEIDPRDQEDNEELSSAISSLMDYVAVNQPFSSGQVFDQNLFSAELRTLL